LASTSVPFTFINLREAVRLYLRDLREFNTLIDAEETPDSIIDLCIQLALDDYNVTAPLTRFSIDNFPAPSILFKGTIIETLRSAGLLQSRNELNYSDGGITVASSNRAPSYQRWIEHFQKDYEDKKLNHKIFLNAQNAYGGIHSEYLSVNYASGFLGFVNMDSFDALRIGFVRPGIGGSGVTGF